jgi:hypothetical protein
VGQKVRKSLARWGGEAKRGIAVIAVDPAYSSKWAVEHWQEPLAAQVRTGTVTRHQAAVVIRRRGTGSPFLLIPSPPLANRAVAQTKPCPPPSNRR